MKAPQLLTASVVLVTSILLTPSGLGQGSLTPPPGPPAPTMKTLDQIEARTPIAGPGAVTISASGSYYLTTNIAVTAGTAITITADNVTLDLNGFTLSSTEASPAGTGILLSGGRTHIHILNGHIKGNVINSGGIYSGSGFAYGISFSVPTPRNVRVTGVSVSGCLLDGISLQIGNSTVAESCTVQTVGGNGIAASSVSDSTAKQCGLSGIVARTASDCLGESSGSGAGVGGSMIQNCYGSSLSGHGVNATTAHNCYGSSSGNGNGVHANTAANCYGTSGGAGSGVKAFDSAYNCAGSSSTGAGNGVDADTATNCKGYSGGSGHGVYARTAQNCYGQASFGDGVNATTAQNCHGQASGGGETAADGVEARTAENCYGTSIDGIGVRADTANNCQGLSNNFGVLAKTANNCYGQTSYGYGVFSDIAIGCYGRKTGSGDFGAGVRFYLAGAMCYGSSGGSFGTSAKVLGGGLEGPVNLP